ncbi:MULTISPECIES: sensor histidine kinase [unclassified Paenibacillus]|uniref:sensor histidine kinase n=1 Tax=unclassified Paenibacillus TaxID=185978 RepID=UPI003635E356
MLTNPPVFKSIRFKLIIGLLLLIIPLILFLIYNNYYAMNVVRNQVAGSNKSLLTLYMNQIDRNLDEADKYLYNMAALENDLLNLDYPKEDINAWYLFAKIRLVNRIETDIKNYKPLDLFFIYSSVNDELMTSKIPGETYDERKALENGILDLLHDLQISDKKLSKQWFVTKIDNQYYLYHIIQSGNAYIGGIVEASKLMVPLSLIELGQSGRSLLVTDAHEVMTNDDFLKENDIHLGLEKNVNRFTSRGQEYLQVNEKSTKGDFLLMIFIPEGTILERLPELQRITTFILLAALLLLPAFYTFIRKVILLPINRIVTAMRKVRDGFMEDRIELYRTSYEFEIMNETFNTMVSQITDLKISVYEEQLINQKAELKHLQLQINPHFFLNSLNIIYSLAQLKSFELIQELSMSLVQYLRFMFRSSLNFVKLSEEIAHTNNYLRIQTMRFPENFTFEIEAADLLSEALVPPLSIQTFVENTIKHAVSMEERIHLQITVDGCEEAGIPFMKVVISDTGKGFPPEVLHAVQSEEGIADENGEHIGIWNVRRRLNLLYQDQARLWISNNTGGGAEVELRLPIRFEKMEDE